LCVVGIMSRRDRSQGAVAVLVLAYLIIRVVRFFDVAI
jgi:hypothetical protein